MTDAGPRGLIPGGALLRAPVAPTSVASFGPVATASTPETTQLAPEEQAAFEQWLRENNIHDLDDPRSHYDYRGAFKAGVGREPGAEGHFPDTFKQHGHETFSNESKYSKGDGGTWEGDTFTPPKSGMRPSVAEPLAKGPIGPLPAAPPKADAPYGMRPGQRHLLPGISNLAHPPPPIDYSKDLVVTAPDGTTIPMHSLNTRDTELVNKLGQSLFNGSGNDAEKRVAGAVTQWGQSMVGQMPIEAIQKTMAERWDHNVGNVIKRDISHDHILAAQANRGAGVPAQQKYNDARSDKWREHADRIIESERRGNKVAALNELDTNFGRMEELLSSGNPTAERIAQMEQLLILTGKASRASEQEGITASAGKWDELKNKMALWTSSDPNLSEAYLDKFKRYIATERASIQQHRKSLARQAATAAIQATKDFGPAVQDEAGNYVYGRMYQFPGSVEFVPPEDKGAPSQAAPPARTAPPAAAAPRAPAARKAPAKPRPKDDASDLD